MSNQCYLPNFPCDLATSFVPAELKTFNPNKHLSLYNNIGGEEEKQDYSHGFSDRETLKSDTYYEHVSRSTSAANIGGPDAKNDDMQNRNMRHFSGRRRFRTNFTEHQSMFLEDSFKESHYPDHKTKKNMAKYLNIPEDRITVWFQNRRAKWRRKENKKDRSKSETLSNFDTFNYSCCPSQTTESCDSFSNISESYDCQREDFNRNDDKSRSSDITFDYYNFQNH